MINTMRKMKLRARRSRRRCQTKDYNDEEADHGAACPHGRVRTTTRNSCKQRSNLRSIQVLEASLTDYDDPRSTHVLRSRGTTLVLMASFLPQSRSLGSFSMRPQLHGKGREDERGVDLEPWYFIYG